MLRGVVVFRKIFATQFACHCKGRRQRWVCTMDVLPVKGREGNGNSRQGGGQKSPMNETQAECSAPAA